MSLAEKRQAARYLEGRHQVSERRVCRVVRLARSTKRRRLQRQERDVVLRGAIHQLALRYPRFGYRKVYVKLQAEGYPVGRDRVRLIRKQEGLGVVKKQKKQRHLGTTTAAATKAQAPNHVWSYDFVHDQTADGKRVKFLTVLDECTRQGLTIEGARHITSGDVIRVLQRLFAHWGPPGCLKSDNGPEFIATAVQRWVAKARVQTRYIEPGKPWQNGHVESFHAVLRDGCLNRWLFWSLRETRTIVAAWLAEYNTERPHGALAGLTPRAFAERYASRKQIDYATQLAYP